MATASYKKNSAYYSTSSFGQFLDILTYRPITTKPDDVVYTVDAIYQFRPDMLAFDLYGDSAYGGCLLLAIPMLLKIPCWISVPGPLYTFLIKQR